MRDWLVEYRGKRGLTQAQMAEKLNISVSYYSYIESGERQKNMDITLVSRLSVILHLKTRQIVELEEKWRSGSSQQQKGSEAWN